MSYEHSTIATNEYEHDLYDHELHDHQAERTHEGHTCSATCKHHHAAEHIDFMDHDEEHIHELGCGHVEYQLVHTEIDMPHVHDEQCGHLPHDEAAGHVDRGKEHSHDTNPEHTDHNHEEEHIHDSKCGHIGYEEASTHVDVSNEEQTANIETGDSTSSNNRTEKTTVQPQQTTDTRTGSATQESKVLSAEHVLESTKTVPNSKITTSEVSRNIHSYKAAGVQLQQAQAIKAPDKAHAKDKQTRRGTAKVHQPLSIESEPNKAFDTAALAPPDEHDISDLHSSLDENFPIEMPLRSTDEPPSLELDRTGVTIDEPFDASSEGISLDVNVIEMGTIDDSPYLSDDAMFDSIKGLATANMNLDFSETTPTMELAEESDHEGTSFTAEEGTATEEPDLMTDFTSTGSDFDFSRFGNSQISNIYDAEWPSMIEVSEQEIESHQDAARIYIEDFLEQANETSLADLQVKSDHLLALLQNIPKESIEEQLPLLEELLELYDLPKLEKFLELYFAGHYQEQTIFTQLFGSKAKRSHTVHLRIGQLVLKLLKFSHQNTQYSAA